MPADIIGYWVPKFYNDALDDPLVFDEDTVGLLSVRNSIPAGFLNPGEMPDAQNRVATADGINRPRPGRDLRATIANCTRVNGICHLSGTTFLIAATVSGASKWYSMVNYVLTDITGLNGAPTFTFGNNIYMVQGQLVIYVVYSAGLYKWDGTNWTSITLSPSHPNLSYVTWFTDRVIVAEAGGNALDMSGFLADGTWDTVNLNLQLDPVINDAITGFCPYQQFQLAVGKKNSLYLVDCDPSKETVTPTPSIANFAIQVISKVIGVAEHNTMRQANNDIIFLSESGKGVFSIGQILTNEQQALKAPLSLPIKSYINRINWSAIHRAHAEVWDDLYILHVPLDGSLVPNYTLVFDITLQTWQGIWLNYNSDSVCLQRFGALDNTTDLVWGDQSGNIYISWHLSDLVFVDTTNGNIASGVQYTSSLTSRGYRYGETFNAIQPFNFVLEFTQSSAIITGQIFADTASVGGQISINTQTSSLLSLPLNLPFNLPLIGNVRRAISARAAGLCTEVQVSLTGMGTWCILRMSGSAWVSHGYINS